MFRKNIKKISLMLAILLITMTITKDFSFAITNIEYNYREKIFIENKINEIYIEIDENDFNNMLENPLAEEYKSANIIVNGTRLNNIAIRTKGNSSLTRVAEDSESDRYSFKIKMDEYQDQSLYGLEKLNLNNCYTDPSYMREYISYKFMEEMDIPTPANAYMKVYINNEEWGLYLAVENVEESFIRTNFETINGDLYKPEKLNFKIEDTDNFNIEDIKESLNLKTNEYNSDYSSIENFIKAINSNEDIENYMDIDEFIKYFAVNTTLVDLDSYQGNNLHNYYLYEQNGKFSIIPWDYDLSFGVFGMMGGGGGRGNQPNNEDMPSDKNMENFIPPNNMEDFDPENMENFNPNNIPDNMKENLSGNNNKIVPENMENNNSESKNNQKKNFGGNMSSINLSDNNINFPIDTPVSGYDIENYPLINSWLSQEKYKEIYHEYLDELVTNYFNESYINNLVGETAKLIQKSVLSDPNKKYTIEEFQSGYEDIIKFVTQRAESIKGQLNGSIESEKEATNIGFKNINNNPPNNMDNKKFNNDKNINTDSKSIKLNIAIAGIIILALLIITFFIFKYPRRGHYKKN